MVTSGTRPHRAVRLAWVAFVVQVAAVAFHQTWHAVGFDEPPSEIGHYLLLHFPLHVGVVLLGAAAGWLVATYRASLPLVLLVVGAVTQHVGIAMDSAAVFADASHGSAAVLFAVGGAAALVAAGLRRTSRETEPSG